MRSPPPLREELGNEVFAEVDGDNLLLTDEHPLYEDRVTLTKEMFLALVGFGIYAYELSKDTLFAAPTRPSKRKENE